MYKKIENLNGYVKDSTSRAILSVDGNSLVAYKRRREYNRSLEKQVDEINIIKGEISDIKQSLVQLLDKK